MPAAAPEIELFFDGLCPLCSREIALMKRLDRRGRIRFTDIAAPDFAPPPAGPDGHAPDAADFMAKIHARSLPAGEWIDGVEVFRRTWSALGLSWLMPASRLPGVSHALDWAYETFASNRLRWTGRCDNGACQRPT